MKQLTFTFFIILLTLSSCNKTVVQYNADFEGTWFSEARYDNVNQRFVRDELVFSGKDGSYQIDCPDTCATNLCHCLEKLSGRAEINASKTIIRLIANYSKTFNLDEEPYQAGGKWLMKIDGRIYYKQ